MAAVDGSSFSVDSMELLSTDVDAAILEVNGRVESVKKIICGSDLQLEITSLEGTKFVLSVSIKGYKITGGDSNCESHPTYESLHTLLSENSPKYRDEFGSSLASALANIQDFESEIDD